MTVVVVVYMVFVLLNMFHLHGYAYLVHVQVRLRLSHYKGRRQHKLGLILGNTRATTIVIEVLCITKRFEICFVELGTRRCPLQFKCILVDGIVFAVVFVPVLLDPVQANKVFMIVTSWRVFMWSLESYRRSCTNM